MTEYINKESILDKIGRLPLNWEYGQAVDDIYKMVEAEPTIRVGHCGECRFADTKDGGIYCELDDYQREEYEFCSEFEPEGGEENG